LSVLYCLVCLSVCNVGVLWPNGWTHQDETWHAGEPWPWPHCARWGLRFPSPKRHSPQFSAHILCGQMARWIKMPLGRKVGLNTSNIVLDGIPVLRPEKRGQSPPIFGTRLLWPNGCTDQDAICYGGRSWSRPHCAICARWGPSSPPQKGGTAPQFLAHVCCGQMTGWIKTPLGTMVGLGPGNTVRCRPSCIPQAAQPQMSAHVCCGQTAGWIKMPLGTKVGLGPDRTVLHRDLALPPKTGTAPQFSAHDYCGRTVVRLSYC